MIPEVGRQKVFQELHVGHPGVSRMKALPEEWRVAWWPGIDSGIENQVRTCADRQENKNHQQPLQSICGSGQLTPGGTSPHRLCRSVFEKIFLVVVDVHSMA